MRCDGERRIQPQEALGVHRTWKNAGRRPRHSTRRSASQCAEPPATLVQARSVGRRAGASKVHPKDPDNLHEVSSPTKPLDIRNLSLRASKELQLAKVLNKTKATGPGPPRSNGLKKRRHPTCREGTVVNKDRLLHLRALSGDRTSGRNQARQHGHAQELKHRLAERWSKHAQDQKSSSDSTAAIAVAAPRWQTKHAPSAPEAQGD